MYRRYFVFASVLAWAWNCAKVEGPGKETALEDLAPVVIVGPRQTVQVGDTVRLDGSSSFDPNPDTVLTYAWSLAFYPSTLGQPPTISNPEAAVASFVPSAVGIYHVKLVVSDGSFLSQELLEVEAVAILNEPPAADAGEDHSISIGVAAVLDGTGSSCPAGALLSYHWSFQSLPPQSQAVLVNSTTATPSFVGDIPGEYIVFLVVSYTASGEILHSDPDSVTVTVTNNRVPVADAGENQQVQVGATVNLNGSGSSDADGDTLSYFWTLVSVPATSTAVLSNASIVNPSFTADRQGSYLVELVVNDGSIDSIASEVLITATAPGANNPPTAVITATSTDVYVDQEVSLNGTASSDPDEDTLTYLWSLTPPSGSTTTVAAPDQAQTSFTPDMPGQYTATLRVDDGELNHTTQEVFTATAVTGAAAHAGPDQDSAPTGGRVVLDGSASFGDFFAWYFVEVPAGHNVGPGVFSTLRNPWFVPQVDGLYVIRLEVTKGETSDIDEVRVTATNVAPIAMAGDQQTVPVGAEVRLNGAESTDANNDALSFFWNMSTRPATSTATLAGAATTTPWFTTDVAGDYVIDLVVTDGVLSSPANADATVTINAVDNAPVADAGVDQHGKPGDPVSLAGSGSGGTGALTYFWQFTRWPSITSEPILSDETAQNPTFIAPAAGVYTVDLIVTDSIGIYSLADSADIVVTVDPSAEAGSDAFSILHAGPCYMPLWYAGLSGSGTVDPNAAPLTYEWELTSVPGGSELLNLTTNESTFTFIPDAAGDYVATLTVTDAYGDQGTDTMTLTVQTPTITKVSGDGQSAEGGDLLLNQLEVQVRTAAGLTPDNFCVLVRFRALSAGGQVTDPDDWTDSNGMADTPVILGPALGPQTFRAELDADPSVFVDFTATAVVGSAAFVFFEEPTVTSVDDSMSLTVRVTDESFNTITTDNTTSFEITTNSSTAGFDDYLSGSGTATKTVTVSSGSATVQVYNTVPEIVRFGFNDTQSTGYRALGRATLLNEDFEDGPGGFVSGPRTQFTGSGIDEWEHGVPADGGPTTGQGGNPSNKVWGTNLTGLYSSNNESALVYRGVNLNGVASEIQRSAVLTFWHYENMINAMCPDGPDGQYRSGALALFGVSSPFSTTLGTGSTYVNASVPTQSSPDGGYDWWQETESYSYEPWYTYERPGWTCAQGAWRQAEFDLSGLAGNLVDLHWVFFYASASVARSTGWYVDEVLLETIQQGGSWARFARGDAVEVVILQPENVGPNQTMEVDIEVRDQFGTLVENDASTFSVQVTGSAVFEVASRGTLNSGAGTQDVSVTASGGRVSLLVNNSTNETVTFSIANPPNPPAAGATVDATFSGAPAILCEQAGDGTAQAVGTSLTLQVKVTDDATGGDCSAGLPAGSGVAWSVTSGSATISDSPTSVVASIAEAELHLGGTAGTVTVHAELLEDPSLFYDFTVTAEPAAPAQVVLTVAPNDLLPVHRMAYATYEVQDEYGNCVTSDNTTSFAIRVGGYAGFTGILTEGSVLSGGGQIYRVQVASGRVTAEIQALIAEQVPAWAIDTEGTGLLMPIAPESPPIYSSTQSLACGCVGGYNDFTFNDVDATSAAWRLDVSVNADINYTYENISVSAVDTGSNLGTVFGSSGFSDCVPQTDSLIISGTQMAALTADGTFTLRLTPTCDVGCCSSNSVSLVIEPYGVQKLTFYAANDVCSDAYAPLGSGSPTDYWDLFGSTIGASNDYDGFGCSGLPSLPGLDVVFQIPMRAACCSYDHVEVTVTPHDTVNSDFAVYIVDDCASPSVCVGSDSSGAGAAESVSAYIGIDGDFFVIVDSIDDGSTFTGDDFDLDINYY